MRRLFKIQIAISALNSILLLAILIVMLLTLIGLDPLEIETECNDPPHHKPTGSYLNWTFRKRPHNTIVHVDLPVDQKSLLMKERRENGHA